MNAWDWLAHASIEDWEIRLLYGTAVPQTLFVLGFGGKNRWWTSLIGWGQFCKALAVGLLVDLAVASDAFGQPPYARQIGLGIILLLFVGAWLQFLAWMVDRARERRERLA